MLLLREEFKQRQLYSHCVCTKKSPKNLNTDYSKVFTENGIFM